MNPADDEPRVGLGPCELVLALARAVIAGAVLYPPLWAAWMAAAPADDGLEAGGLVIAPRPAQLLGGVVVVLCGLSCWRVARAGAPARRWLSLEEKCLAVTAAAALGLYVPYWVALAAGLVPPRDPTLPMLSTTSAAVAACALAFWPRLAAGLVTGLFGGGIGVVAGYVGGSLAGRLLVLGLGALGAPELVQEAVGGAALVSGAVGGVLVGLRVFGLVCDLD